MQIFVTGASGFVGGAATRALIAHGHKVVAMSRSERSDAAIMGMGAKPVRCDLESLEPAHMKGCKAVVHCAAFVEAWGPRDAWFEANVLGTQHVLDAARTAGIRRFIHIGTEAAIVHGQDIHDADETYPLSPNSPFPYCATKAQAELRARAANEPGGMETIVLRPRFIWGPGDTTLLPAVEAMAKSGQWMWIGGGKAMTSTTYIDNLVQAIELALTKGRGGEAYFILDDGNISMKDIITGMASSRGLALPDKSIPAWIADIAGMVCEGIWRLFSLKGMPPLTAHAAMVMSRDCTLNGAKARAELGYKPVVTVAEGLKALKKANAKS